MTCESMSVDTDNMSLRDEKVLGNVLPGNVKPMVSGSVKLKVILIAAVSLQSTIQQ